MLAPLLKQEFDAVLNEFQQANSQKDLIANPQKETLINQIVLNRSSKQHTQRILSEFCSYGPLDSLIQKPNITEIIINNQNDIFYEDENGFQKSLDSFLSKVTFKNIVEKMMTESKLTINYKKPFAEGRWKHFRLHITGPPIVKNDFHISLRKQEESPWSFKKLYQNNWAPQSVIQNLKQIIEEKNNFLIVGPTSSGKTSVLNACLQEVKNTERVITIEDADEIALPNSLSTKLLTQTNAESTLSLIGQESLLKQSLRLRPDRLVMGEVRGPEAKDLLLALSSGHQGSIGTIHGNNHKQALLKLEMLTQMNSPQWQSLTVQKLIFSSLQYLIVLEKHKELRFLKGIYKINAHESTGFLFDIIYEKNSNSF